MFRLGREKMVFRSMDTPNDSYDEGHEEDGLGRGNALDQPYGYG
jgi:hypothetical protein